MTLLITFGTSEILDEVVVGLRVVVEGVEDLVVEVITVVGDVPEGFGLDNWKLS